MDLFSFLEAATTPKVGQKPWMSGCKFTLGTAANINDMVDACIKSGLYGFDLECSGLDNRVYNGHTVDHIAGFCLSPDGVEGYYIPIAHDPNQYDHVNVPGTVWRPAMKRLVESEAVAVFHNGKFDQEFLQFNGGEPVGEWDSPKAWEDTLILAYLRNTRARSKGLKALVYTPTDADETAPTGGPGLGLEMIELHELWGHAKPEKGFRYDFTMLDPSWEPALWYAASDAICTLRLHKILAPTVVNPPPELKLPNQRTIYIIEKLCITATRWMERNRIYVDMKKVHELVTLGQQEWFDSIMDIYQEALNVLGRDIMPHHYRLLKEIFTADSTKDLVPEQLTRVKREAKREDMDPVGDVEVKGKKYPMIYDVNAPTQLGQMFEEMGIQGLKYTDKSGQVKTNKDALDEIIEHEGAKFPFMAKIKRFRETWKALSTYLYPMLIDCDPTDHTMKINFQGLKVDTGRFSTPASGGEHIKGVPKVNLQSIPATYDPKRPECMTRARECIAARPGRILFAADYAGEELRLVTNLSKEPKWLAEFFRCSGCNHAFNQGDGDTTPMPPPPRCPVCGSDKIGDLHTLTSLSVYGADAMTRSDWKDLRQNGKRLNFAMAYGGGGTAAMRAVNCDKNEGWRIKQQFDGSYPGLRGWWDTQHVFAKKHGYVLTAFGRKYPVPDIYSSDGGFRSKAERNSVNGPIQGCLHGDVRVPTSLGICRIQDLSGNTFNVWTGTKWVEGRAFPSGQKPLVYTTLSSGQVLRTSPDHRFQVYETGLLGWVRQEDLTPDMWVTTDAVGVSLPEQTLAFSDTERTAHNKKGYVFNGNQEALWELLGLVIGDGSIRTDGLTVHVGGSDAEKQARAYASYFESTLGLNPTVTEILPEESRMSRWKVNFWNTAFREFCRELGLGDWNTYTKRVPEAVWAQARKHQAAFLRGYFSADGCVNVAGAVDVRSTNESLLLDTHGLLRSLGIRSTVRLDSKRVAIKDRSRFRELVGAMIPAKTARLALLQENPWTGQWHALPPPLIAQIGELLYQSSIYAGLSRAEKSAVLRLKVGSGSKPQCQRYLAKLPAEEVPASITALLQYDYEQVVGVEHSGESVEMYDVEVFDDTHAFVADGVIVHNSGADICKLAMGLIYKEFKRRGWLERARMIVTMHDELVFEVEIPILEEVIEVTYQIMTRNDMLMKQKWKIPLTSDVEIGYNWSVPWDLNAMRAGEVRFIGNKKYKDKTKLPAGYQWENLPSFPADLEPHFQRKTLTGGPVPTSSAPSATSPPTTPPSTPPTTPPASTAPTQAAPPSESVAALPAAPTPEPVVAAKTQVEIPTGAGAVFDYRIQAPLTMQTLVTLADLIRQCRGGGSQELRLYTATGEPLDEWRQSGNHPPVFVNATQFHVLAEHYGLA